MQRYLSGLLLILLCLAPLLSFPLVLSASEPLIQAKTEIVRTKFYENKTDGIDGLSEPIINLTCIFYLNGSIYEKGMVGNQNLTFSFSIVVTTATILLYSNSSHVAYSVNIPTSNSLTWIFFDFLKNNKSIKITISGTSSVNIVLLLRMTTYGNTLLLAKGCYSYVNATQTGIGFNWTDIVLPTSFNTVTKTLSISLGTSWNIDPVLDSFTALSALVASVNRYWDQFGGTCAYTTKAIPNTNATLKGLLLKLMKNGSPTCYYEFVVYDSAMTRVDWSLPQPASALSSVRVTNKNLTLTQNYAVVNGSIYWVGLRALNETIDTNNDIWIDYGVAPLPRACSSRTSQNWYVDEYYGLTFILYGDLITKAWYYVSGWPFTLTARAWSQIGFWPFTLLTEAWKVVSSWIFSLTPFSTGFLLIPLIFLVGVVLFLMAVALGKKFQNEF